MDRWVTFDCYGTLMNWKAGLAEIVQPLAGERTDALVDALAYLEPPIAARQPHLSYRQVLSQTLQQAAARELIPFTAEQHDLLADGWGRLPAFPDASDALAGLRSAGWRPAVLTNCDDDLFAHSARTLGQPLDEVVTAEQVRSYKPVLNHFREFAARTGAGPSNWVHVGNSWMADIVSAARLGLPRVWIDRDRSGHDPSLATIAVPDAKDLAEVVGRALDMGAAPGIDPLR
ncbi:HAD family hydrolase [Nonomuraea sp. NPDC052129]|uniref:HAD family hydrolase n=1 Tax=Nonomuraea sp. NPDC052129 TaxID=3154651 RepID=UPI00341E426B